MRVDWRGVYQRGLLGGLGGLIGWALMSLLAPASPSLFVSALSTGGLVGVSMGVCCGAWEGMFRSRSTSRAVKGAMRGAVIGACGGMVGLFLGELFYWISGGGLANRAFGWAVFGALLGTNDGLSRRMVTSIKYGAFGGFLGGLLGGSTYEWLYGICRVVLPRDLSQAVGGAIGLVILGLFIGGLIGLVEDLLRAAWLLFLNGRLEGQTRTLDPQKAITSIGRSETSDICILNNVEIKTHHARIVVEGGAFYLEPNEGQSQIDRGGQAVAVVREQLNQGDVLVIGGQRMRFMTGDAT